MELGSSRSVRGSSPLAFVATGGWTMHLTCTTVTPRALACWTADSISDTVSLAAASENQSRANLNGTPAASTKYRPFPPTVMGQVGGTGYPRVRVNRTLMDWPEVRDTGVSNSR